MSKVWQVLIPLAGVVVALALWWGFADDMHLSERERVVFRAAVLGIAIVGAVKVLLRLIPSSPSNRSQTPNQNIHGQAARKAPESWGDDQ